MREQGNRASRIGALGLALAVTLAPVPALASSHSDAPLISLDPAVNTTDVYAFIANDFNGDPTLTVVANYVPFEVPGNGPNYFRFDDNVLYEIHITHPTTGAEQITYQFSFSDANPTGGAGLRNPDTILSYGELDGGFPNPITSIEGPGRNYLQTYAVRRVDSSGTSTRGTGIPTAPPNVGRNVTFLYNDSAGNAISGATQFSELDFITQQAIATLSTGETVFAGPREDGFYADLGAFFDFVDLRVLDNNGTLGDGLGQDGGGVDTFRGFNVNAIAIQVPLSELEPSSYTAPLTGASSMGVGVYTSASRSRIVLRRTNGDPFEVGQWVRVSRMGNPLFNEAFVALRDKDRYNRTSPTGDATAFGSYALNPELASILELLYPSLFPSVVGTGRTDLHQIFIPDVLKVATTTGPVPLAGQTGFSRFGVFGGDTAGGQSSGWPNGRRFGDDVVDIALTALASGPSYTSITPVGDNVHANDQVYNQVFPYAATPHSGIQDPCP